MKKFPMKPMIARRPHLTARIATSLILQILLIVPLSRPHQDSMIFNLSLMLIAVFAMVPVAFVTRWLSFWTILMIRLLGVFPLWVFLATLMHLLWLSGWLNWLLRIFDNRAGFH